MRIVFRLEIGMLVLLLASGTSLWAKSNQARLPAQDNSGSGYKFQPPRPPPLDGENFDDDDDAMDLGDDGFRPPPPPPPPGGGNGMNGAGGYNPGFNPNDNRPQASNYGNTNTSAKKFHFQVVPDEYWEKGKKRTRGNQVHVTGGSDDK